jgi:flagellar biosynthesis regulator FlbT
MNQEAINQARLLYYAFFAKILDFVEKEEAYADIETLLDIFSANPLDESTLEAFLSIKNHLKTEVMFKAHMENEKKGIDG